MYSKNKMIIAKILYARWWPQSKWRVLTKSSSMRFTVCTGKQRDDVMPRAIIAHFVNCAKPDVIFGIEEKSLPTLQTTNMIILVLSYACETAKEQRKLSNALRNARRMNLVPVYLSRTDGFSFKEIHFQHIIYYNIFVEYSKVDYL